MSHSVTIQTRTVTTGSPSALNTSFFKTWTGVLKLVQVICGITVMSLLLTTIDEQPRSRDIFLMLMATSFMMGTGIFIISYIFSPISEPIIGKTNYELIYNGLATLLLLIGGLVVATDASYATRNPKLLMAAGIIGIIDAVFYAVNFAWAIRLKFNK